MKLSALNNQSKAINRDHLVELGNADSLDSVDHAMINICLDDFAYNSPDQCMKVK